MKIVVDACTLILLAKAGVLDEFVALFDAIVPQAVYDEVLAGKTKGAIDALISERLYQQQKLQVVMPKNIALIKKCATDFGMGLGEAQVIVHSLSEHVGVVATDNKQGRKAARVHNLQTVGSIEIIVALYRLKKISLTKAHVAFEELQKSGWFHHALIEQAHEEVKP